MKTNFLFALLAFAALSAFAEAHHYAVTPVDAKDAELAAAQMEDRFAVYNRLFRFDPARAPLPLKVRLIADTGEYNRYVLSKAGAAVPGAAYLHYAGSGNRELVINSGGEGAAEALPYQAFTQFFRAFVPQPPAWMREGFAVFFTTLAVSPDGALSFRENLAWLNTVKAMKERPPLERILTADAAEGEHFQALAWSLVSFFMNSGKEEHRRVLTDSFMALSASASEAENAEAVMRRILLDATLADISAEYQNYLDSRKTFAELAGEGRKAHAGGDRARAELFFRDAMDMNGDHFLPYYYLGLLAYDAKNFDRAEQYYRSSQQRGADPALVLYALGLNAFAAGKLSEAADYLRQAAAAAPERYKDKAEKLIARLQ